jgi:predicted Zn-dependent protease with MMP-like domain
VAIDISDEEFETIVRSALDDIPVQYGERLDNLAFVIEDDPTPVQLQKLNLHAGQTLYGLYEGVPLTGRGSNYSGVLPDKITIFKNPAVLAAQSREDLIGHIQRTIWHEVAHYFGLDHERINELDTSEE